MKIIFISDIHGIKTNLDKIREKFLKLNCDKLVVLGDIYKYYGSIMDEEYDQEYIQEFLESFKGQLICMKGNCDSNIDIETSNFLIEDGVKKITTIKEDLYVTHGHNYNESNWEKTNSILIYGHLHKPFIKQIETNIYINPGSISLPRTEIGPTYLFYDETKFIIYDLEDNIIAIKDMKN